jgi:hypothetical protein
VDTGSRKEIASKPNSRALVLIQAEPIRLESMIGKVEAGFPSGQTRSVCPEIMLKQRDQVMMRFQPDRIMI